MPIGSDPPGIEFTRVSKRFQIQEGKTLRIGWREPKGRVDDLIDRGFQGHGFVGFRNTPDGYGDGGRRFLFRAAALLPEFVAGDRISYQKEDLRSSLFDEPCKIIKITFITVIDLPDCQV